MDKTLTRVQR